MLTDLSKTCRVLTVNLHIFRGDFKK